MIWIVRALRGVSSPGRRAPHPGSDRAGAGDGLPKYMTFDCRDGMHEACLVCRCTCHREPPTEEIFLAEAAPETQLETQPESVIPPSPDAVPALRRV